MRIQSIANACALSLLAFGAFSTSAFAASGTTTFPVTATVINSCIISSTGIAFGNYDPTVATALTATGAVTAKCTKGDVVSVALGQGVNIATGSTAAVPARQMKLGTGADLLPYHIYIAGTGTTEWGTGSPNQPASQTSTSVGSTLTFATFGSIPAGADVSAGSYSDSVIATVTF